jgi:beta-lactamase class A
MGGRRHGLFLTLITVLALTAGLAATAAPASAAVAGNTPICVSARHPKLAARLSRRISASLSHRQGAVGLAVADDGIGLSCALNEDTHFYAASVIKATIISALLLKAGGVSHLTARQRQLAWAMITQSDNNAATALWNQVGMRGMQRFLNRARMTSTILNDAWGLTLITARDEVILLQLISTKGHVLSTPSRRYVLYLMAHVEPGQRWGVTAGAPAKVTIHVKNGWLPYPVRWNINSIGAFTGPGLGYQIAMLTSGNPSMGYGIDTIEGACQYLNWNLPAF